MQYYRPTTRGELKGALQEGRECEVAEYVIRMLGNGEPYWLEFPGFVVRDSENKGWKVFSPVKED